MLDQPNKKLPTTFRDNKLPTTLPQRSHHLPTTFLPACLPADLPTSHSKKATISLCSTAGPPTLLPSPGPLFLLRLRLLQQSKSVHRNRKMSVPQPTRMVKNTTTRSGLRVSVYHTVRTHADSSHDDDDDECVVVRADDTNNASAPACPPTPAPPDALVADEEAGEASTSKTTSEMGMVVGYRLSRSFAH